MLVAFPYTTDSGETHTKRRPAVVVSNDYNNARLDDVLVVPLTATSVNEAHDLCVVVPMNSPEGQKAGLRLDSIINCTTIATIPKKLLVSKIGAFSESTIKQIDECIMGGIDPNGGLAGAPVPQNPPPADQEAGATADVPKGDSDKDSE